MGIYISLIILCGFCLAVGFMLCLYVHQHEIEAGCAAIAKAKGE